jgi:membrane protein
MKARSKTVVDQGWRLLKKAAAGWWEDRAMSLGGALAFFTVFSLAPILLVAIAVAGLAFGQQAAEGAIVGEIGGLVGPKGAAAIEEMVASAGDFGSGIIGTVVGAAIFLLTATGVFVELQDDLNQIWKVRPPDSYGLMDFIRARFLSMALVLGIGFLLLVSLLIDAGISAFGGYLEASFSAAALIIAVLNNVFGFAIAVLLFAMIFKILPAVDLRWSDVWIGALGTAFLFTLGKLLIGFYLGQSGLVSSYGAAGSVMTVLLWIYYSSLLLLFGAEFTKAFAEAHGSRVGRSTSDGAR